MEAECRYRICGNRVWINAHLVALDSPVAGLRMFRDRIAESGIKLVETGVARGPAVTATAIGQSGTIYDIDPQGTVFRTRTGRSAYLAAPLSLEVVVSVEGQTLKVGRKTVELAGPFSEIAFLQNLVVLVVERATKDVNTAFGVDKAGQVVWRIQAPECADRIGGVVPYVGVSVSDGQLTVIDFWGREFAVDPGSGRVAGDILRVHH